MPAPGQANDGVLMLSFMTTRVLDFTTRTQPSIKPAVTLPLVVVLSLWLRRPAGGPGFGFLR